MVLSVQAAAGSTNAAAQDTASAFYGGVGIELTRITEEVGLFVSLSGGYRADDFFVGLKLYDLLNGPELQDGRHTKLHFLGLELGWMGGEKGAWRPAASMLVGGGDVSAYIDLKRDDADRSWFFVLQPALSLGLPVDWAVLPMLDVGWRYILGSRTPGTSDALLGGPSVAFSVRFPQ